MERFFEALPHRVDAIERDMCLGHVHRAETASHIELENLAMTQEDMHRERARQRPKTPSPFPASRFGLFWHPTKWQRSYNFDMMESSEPADIDDVLKESEALLDRLQFSDDVFDGGSSLASIGSTSLFLSGAGERTATSSIAAESTRSRESNGKSSSTPPLPSTPVRHETHQQQPLPISRTIPSDAEILAKIQQQQLDPPPSPAGPAKWEKVSSAAMGDDDYVPIVDYSKEKRKVLPPTAPRTRVSRVEAFREKARRERKRRRRLGFIAALVVCILLWVCFRRQNSDVALDNQETDAAKKEETTVIETISDFTVSQEQNLTTNETEKECSRNLLDEFSKILEESLCMPPPKVAETKEELQNETSSSATATATTNQTKEIVRLTCQNNIVALLLHDKCQPFRREGRKAITQTVASWRNLILRKIKEKLDKMATPAQDKGN